MCKIDVKNEKNWEKKQRIKIMNEWKKGKNTITTKYILTNRKIKEKGKKKQM